MKKEFRYLFIIVFIIVAVISLFIGSLPMHLLDLWRGNGEAWHILGYSRLPRLLAIVFTGVCLSISGLILQKLTQNRFVSPSTAVTMDAARFGIVIGIVWFPQLPFIGKSLFALVFSLIATLLFITLLKRLKFKNVVFVPLLGIMLGMIVDAMTQFVALRYDMVQVLSGYMLGSFTYIMRGNYELLYLSIPFIGIAFCYMFRFNIVAMGSDFAANIGLDYRKVQMYGILIVSVLTALVVVTVGSVPFVGLVVPNLVSYLFGDGARYTLWDTALLGVGLVLVADVVSRVVIAPFEIPIGLTLGVVGALVFGVVLLRGGHETSL